MRSITVKWYFDIPWLTFSRIRPEHTFDVIFAFGVSALMGTCYYVMRRTRERDYRRFVEG